MLGLMSLRDPNVAYPAGVPIPVLCCSGELKPIGISHTLLSEPSRLGGRCRCAASRHLWHLDPQPRWLLELCARDSFLYAIDDGHGDTASATLTLTLTGAKVAALDLPLNRVDSTAKELQASEQLALRWAKLSA
jgi:hypothetical protein